MSDDERRHAVNESVSRHVNEAIERGRWPGEEGAPAAFRCECSRLDCNTLLEITPREYERVRAHPRRFVVLPDHVSESVEVVVGGAPGYAVVEKRDEAGAVAEATDPRS
jgi:hypothetical protein